MVGALHSRHVMCSRPCCNQQQERAQQIVVIVLSRRERWLAVKQARRWATVAECGRSALQGKQRRPTCNRPSSHTSHGATVGIWNLNFRSMLMTLFREPHGRLESAQPICPLLIVDARWRTDAMTAPAVDADNAVAIVRSSSGSDAMAVDGMLLLLMEMLFPFLAVPLPVIKMLLPFLPAVMPLPEMEKLLPFPVMLRLAWHSSSLSSLTSSAGDLATVWLPSDMLHPARQQPSRLGAGLC